MPAALAPGMDTLVIVMLVITLPVMLFALTDTLTDLLGLLGARIVAGGRAVARAVRRGRAIAGAARHRRAVLALRWPPALTQLEFENWVREYLALRGWQVAFLPQPMFEPEVDTDADQPIPLLARRGRAALLLICPKAPPASGTAEMPQFAAQRDALGADLAVVITAVQRPPGFMQAALRHGVRVMHYRDLSRVA